MNAKKIIYNIFLIIFIMIFTSIVIFYLDLANGPMPLLIFELAILAIYVTLRIVIKNLSLRKRIIMLASFVGLSIIVMISSKPYIGLKNAVDYNNPTKTEVLEVEGGKIQGVYNKDNSVKVYAGIPYAKPPVKELRWKEPQNVEPWDGIRDCSKFQNRSYQKISSEVMSSLVDIYAQKSWHPDFSSKTIEGISEDSLYLNVWRPNTNETNLPVLMFIHGGSLNSGSAAFDDYNGEEMAKKGIIMITIQYRLGIFGYFAHKDLIEESNNNTTGNYGLLDQIKALKWINDNIEAFGGDKTNITIAGESAGSSSVSAICTSPLAKGLFKRAIGESSSLVMKKPPHTYRSLDKALEVGNKIMTEFNAKNINDLRNVKASDLVNTKNTISEMTLDGYALTKNPYDIYLDNENNEEALLNGYNVLEADAFVIPTYLTSPTNKGNIKERLTNTFGEATASKMIELYKEEIDKDAFKVFNEIFSVYWFIYPHHSWSTLAYINGTTVYRYQFTKENGYYSTYHSGEMIYAYGNVKNSKYGYRYNDSDKKLSDIMLNYWANFVKTGNPNDESNPNWAKWDNNPNNIMELGSNVGLIKDKYLDLYNIIEDYMN